MQLFGNLLRLGVGFGDFEAVCRVLNLEARTISNAIRTVLDSSCHKSYPCTRSRILAGRIRHAATASGVPSTHTAAFVSALMLALIRTLMPSQMSPLSDLDPITPEL